MNKSSFLNNNSTNKSAIALICIIAMVVGFMVSRVVLSISMFLYGINALIGTNPKDWLKNKWWLTGIAWVALYAITYFWTSDKGNLGARIETKLPFLILPLAFAYAPRLNPRQLQIIALAIGSLFVVSACYSVSFLIRNPAYYIWGYKVSQMLPTLPKEDHIRTSTSMVLYIIWVISLWSSFPSGTARRALASIACVLVVFLHILAAKSGLVSLYLFLVCWSFYILIKQRKLAGLIIILGIPLFLALAIRVMPTFRERANYIDYTYFMLKHSDKSGLFGDLSRIISYQLAIDLIKQHPLRGVGAGDVKTEMDTAYARNYPDFPASARLVPHNQFLTVALGCGIPAMIVFAIWVFMPLRLLRNNKRNFFLFMTWFILLFQLMIEPVLEVQLGVFLVLFFLLLQTTALPPPDDDLLLKAYK